jgi:hypothetical protein
MACANCAGPSSSASGGKRYKRVTITPANNTGNVFVAAVWVTKPPLTPTPNPPL